MDTRRLLNQQLLHPMIMDNAIRLQYLEAMGIDVWISRRPVPGMQALTVAENGDDTGGDVKPGEQQPVKSLSETEQWDQLQTKVSQCTKCPLCETRTQTVFGSGNRHADWMLIGEAPGQQEDLQGQPFVGTAGLLLSEMLRAIGLTRDEVYIANILKCRPPGNRDPRPDEVAGCRDHLQLQLALIRPKIILAVGRIAAQTLLNTNEPLSKLRSKIHTFNETPVVVVYHPAYLLRSLADKKKAWLDLQFAMRVYQNIKG